VSPARWRSEPGRTSVLGMPSDGWQQTTHPNAPVSAAPGTELELVVVHPPELAGTRFALVRDLVFGRAPDPEIACIPHVTISRRHAAIRPAMGGILCLDDLGSRNGSKVDGSRPDVVAPLVPQTVVRLGDVHAVVDEPCRRRFDADSVLPGASAVIERARAKLDQSTGGNAPVLIIGETGTGKERLAHEVHRASGRRGRYVTLNCAELSPQLIESQLFGHEKGAFTGAAFSSPGLFSAAQGGTLFLDEIGELRLDLQPKLLRVLQEGELRRVGSVETLKVDVRVVAATNRDLSALVDQDVFRRDLYARLCFHELRLPPLRERRQDVLPWIALLAARQGVNLSFAPDSVEKLLLHPWPDNLRGLDRLVHRLVGHAGVVGLRALHDAMPELFSFASRGEARASGEAEVGPSQPPRASSVPAAAPPVPSRDEFVSVYTALGRSVRAAAKHFGRDRRQIYRWLERYGIPRDDSED
jgi:transcriptional regulator with GAF, ATPase, and Fis domain